MGIKDRTTLDVEVRTAKLEAKEKELIANGVRFVQMEFIDINGRVRGKLSPVQQAVSPGGFGVSSFIQAILSGDNVCLSPYGNFDNGIPKLSVIPDPDTFRQWTWKPDTAMRLMPISA
jgi:glutamine synthetase